MSFLRPSYQGESERNFRVFEAILLGGKMLGFQKSKRKKEIELERERERDTRLSKTASARAAVW